jgi:CubicO group peptidase (beta-lactamase class C family)
MKRSDAIPMFSYMPEIHSLRMGYCYNNFGYEIAGQIVEKLSGESLNDLFVGRITKPLNLSHTHFGAGSTGSNEAKAYMTLKDGSTVKIGVPFADRDILMAAAGGARSSVSDLTTLYTAYMEAGNAELEFDAQKVAENSPFRQVGRIWEPCINFPFRVLREYSYSLGWCRTQLPGPLALPNVEADRSQLPIVGKGTTSRLAISHEGAISGIVSFAALFPETTSSVIVLSNSTPLNYDGPGS